MKSRCIRILSLILVFLFVGVMVIGCSSIEYVGIILNKYESTWLQMMPVYNGSGFHYIPITHHDYKFDLSYEKGTATITVSQGEYYKYNIGDEYTFRK